MRRPENKRNVDFGYAVVNGGDYLLTGLHRTRQKAITAYENCYTNSNARFKLDADRYGLRVVKAELRVVEEWNPKSKLLEQK